MQGAAGYDGLRFVENDQAALTEFTSDTTAKIGSAICGGKGAAVARALTADDSKQGGNVVTRGLSSVGRGFKRLFGGGSHKKKQ